MMTKNQMLLEALQKTASDAVEKDLMDIVPDQYKKTAHHLLILHGRYTCKARNPECEKCVISKECIHFLNVNYGKIKNFL
jgi:endonuclease-3